MLAWVFVFLGVFMLFSKRGGVLSWLFNLEIFALGLILFFMGGPMQLILGLILSVSSACVLVTFLVSVLVTGSSTSLWSFSF